MSIPYKINPVKATCKKYDGSLYGIQGLNDTCFGICAAYSGTVDVFDMDPQCTKSCSDFIEERRKTIFGVGKCDHQTPYRPVIWEQFPRYVPILLREGEPVETVLEKCRKYCDEYNGNLANECKDTCKLDYDAIEFDNGSKNNTIPQRTAVSAETSEKETHKKSLKIILIVVSIFVLLFTIYFLFFFK